MSDRFFSSTHLNQYVSDKMRNKWMQQARGYLASTGSKDPVRDDFIIRQVVHMCSLAFMDGMIAQLEKDQRREVVK